jgi:hypothetical protein
LARAVLAALGLPELARAVVAAAAVALAALGLAQVAQVALAAFLAVGAAGEVIRIMASILVQAVLVLAATSACIAGKETRP